MYKQIFTLAVLQLIAILAQNNDACQQPRNVGQLCTGNNARQTVVQRYYYDSRSGKCFSFVYAGCGGNENRFATMAECQQRCASASSGGGGSTGTQACPANQVWDECGSACPETCANKPEVCMAMCKVGCRCRDGYVLDSNGNCILKSACPPSESKKCQSDSDCPTGQSCPMVMCFVPPCERFCVSDDPVTLPAPVGGCASMMCAMNSRCVEDENGVGKCVPLDQAEPGNPVILPLPTAGCAAMLCATNSRCVEDANGVGQCVPLDVAIDPPMVTCASTLCITGTTCQMQNNKPVCVPNSRGPRWQIHG